MTTKVRKAVILGVKLLVAGVLLAWVISQVHWDDYVQTADGKMYAVVGKPDPMAKQVKVVEVQKWQPWKRSEVDRSVSSFEFAGTKNENLPADQKPVTFEQVKRRGMHSALDQMNTWLLLLACAGFLCSVLIIAVRWWLLLGLQDVRIKLWQAVRLTFLGQFFNYFLPGSVGGDVVKAYYVSKHTHRKASVWVSVFVDRALGLVEVVVLGGVMVSVVLKTGLGSWTDMRRPALVLGVAAAAILAAMTFLFSSRLRRILHLQKLYQRLPIAHHVAAVGDAVRLYRARMGGVAKAIALTFGGQIISISSVACIGMSLHLDTPWYTYFAYVPVIYILTAIPITPGAVGVAEALYTKAFYLASPSGVIVLALLARLVPMFWSLPGAIVYITGPKLPKAKDMEAELNAEEVNPQITQINAD